MSPLLESRTPETLPDRVPGTASPVREEAPAPIPGGREAVLPRPGRLVEREFQSPLEALGFLLTVGALVGAIVGEGLYSVIRLTHFLLSGGRGPRSHFRQILRGGRSSSPRGESAS